jgi:hypothetical protein
LGFAVHLLEAHEGPEATVKAQRQGGGEEGVYVVEAIALQRRNDSEEPSTHGLLHFEPQLLR